MLYQDILSLIIFVVLYLSFIFFPNQRAFSSFSAAFLVILFKIISFSQAVSVINWNVIGIFVGMLMVADAFMFSRVPAYLAEVILKRVKKSSWAVLFICLLTSFISAFVENVATVLIIAPIAFSLARKLKLNPTKMMIAIAISSNLQGAATLIGDPPSMLLAGFAKLNFLDFFFYQGKPSIFFAVQLGALTSFVILYFIFKREKGEFKIKIEEKIKSYFPTLILLLLVLVLALASFLDNNSSYSSGIICLFFGTLVFLWQVFKYRGSFLLELKKLDWETTIFLIGIFVVIGAITLTGWVERLAALLANLVGTNIFLGYTVLVFFAMAVSAFVDNVPFLVAMLPVAITMSEKLGINPQLFLFGLLIGASLGGNITPIGASANIVACGLLKKEGYKVSFKNFIYLGFPFTLAAIIPAYLFVWFIWKK